MHIGSLPHVGPAGAGPDLYINTRNNTLDHGPGSQRPEAKLLREADPCFGQVVRGHALVRAIVAMPSRPGTQFLERPVQIVRARVRRESDRQESDESAT